MSLSLGHSCCTCLFDITVGQGNTKRHHSELPGYQIHASLWLPLNNSTPDFPWWTRWVTHSCQESDCSLFLWSPGMSITRLATSSSGSVLSLGNQTSISQILELWDRKYKFSKIVTWCLGSALTYFQSLFPGPMVGLPEEWWHVISLLFSIIQYFSFWAFDQSIYLSFPLCRYFLFLPKSCMW